MYAYDGQKKRLQHSNDNKIQYYLQPFHKFFSNATLDNYCSGWNSAADVWLNVTLYIIPKIA